MNPDNLPSYSGADHRNLSPPYSHGQLHPLTQVSTPPELLPVGLNGLGSNHPVLPPIHATTGRPTTTTNNATAPPSTTANQHDIEPPRPGSIATTTTTTITTSITTTRTKRFIFI